MEGIALQACINAPRGFANESAMPMKVSASRICAELNQLVVVKKENKQTESSACTYEDGGAGRAGSAGTDRCTL